ncbi:hypothetical protein D9758_014894 [Tetrapyrgos nigripes]|uniref:F-box domain-containing protein n=1 Tax=Tetrapyrgos nigripes TaxID=182062 RepID=A0A8H5FK29_9AGAR|nr:hypothetical protein D9758_014894 [Tetrapyrgos nigripes]
MPLPALKMPEILSTLPTELLGQIFSHLVEEQDLFLATYYVPGFKVLTRDSKRDLLSCALSTKPLFHSAISVLWHTVGLIPLLKLLPDFSHVDGTCILTGEGEYNEDALERFDLYSSKVKLFILHGISKVDSSVYPRLALSRPRPLPSLTHLHCFTSTFSNATMFMVSPRLRSAFFRDPRDADLSVYLSLAHKEAPDLHSLSFSYTTRYSFPLISRPENLRSFELTLNMYLQQPFDMDFRSLYHMTSLESLTISSNVAVVRKEDMEKRDWVVSGSLSNHTTLKRLEFNGHYQDITIALELLKLYEYSPLESLSIGMARFDEDQCKTFFLAIPSSWATTLTHLTIDFKVGTFSQVSLSSLIQPLYTLSGVEEFRISSLYQRDFYILDSDISDICEAWPNLTRLELDIPPKSEWPRLPTVSSLPILSLRCPRLKTLTLPLDVLHVPPIDIDKTEGSVAGYSGVSGGTHDLERLFIHVSEEAFLVVVEEGVEKEEKEEEEECNSGSRHADLARHLHMAFPFLREVEVKEYADYERWEKVNRLLEICQDTRRNQRRVQS